MQEARSHIATRKEQAKTLKAVVIDMLQWDELEYATFQNECGLAYLRFYIPGDKWGQDMLDHSKLFWNWWKNQWMMRDEEFVNLDMHVQIDKVSTENLRRTYWHLHDASILASEIYPNRTVLDESYNQMIHSIHHDELYA